MAKTYPHMSDQDSFPDVGQVDVWKFKNDFDYSKFDEIQMRITLCSVPWDVGLIHVGDAQISGLGNVVAFESASDRDSYIESIEDKIIFETEYRKFYAGSASGGIDGKCRVPIPIEACTRFNYLRVEYSELPVNLEHMNTHVFLYFIREPRRIATNTTELDLLLDTWQTFLPGINVKISHMMLERGHAPIASLSADDFLANPLANTKFVTGSDVNFGDESGAKTAYESQVVFNDGATVYACIVTDSSVTGLWGIAKSTWQMPQTRELNTQGVPNYRCFAILAVNFNSFIRNIDTSIPQFKQSVKAVFFATEKTITLGNSFAFGGYTVYNIDATCKTNALLTLDKSKFGYDSKYANLAKLYTFPYAHIEIVKDDGTADVVRIEDTTGTLEVDSSLSIAYPFIGLTANVSGIGSNSRKNITFKNLDSRQMRLGGRWQTVKLDWNVPVFAVVQDNATYYDYSTHFDRVQKRNDADTTETNAKASNQTEYINGYDVALTQYQIERNNAQTEYSTAINSNVLAKENSDRTNAANNSNSIDSANTARTNAVNSANTEQRNSVNSADTSHTNVVNSANTEQRNSVNSANTNQTNAVNAANTELSNANSNAGTIRQNAYNIARASRDNTQSLSATARQNSYNDAQLVVDNSSFDVAKNNTDSSNRQTYNNQMTAFNKSYNSWTTWIANRMVNATRWASSSAQKETASIGLIGSSIGSALNASLGGTASAVTNFLQAGVGINLTEREAEIQVDSNTQRNNATENNLSNTNLFANAQVRFEAQSENDRITGQANNTGATTRTNANNTHNANVSTSNFSYDTEITNANNSYNVNTTTANNTRNTQTTNADNTRNTAVTNADNSRNTTVRNADNTRNTAVTNADNSRNTAVTNADNSRNTAVTNANRTKATADANTNATKTFNDANARLVRDNKLNNALDRQTVTVANVTRDRNTKDANATRTKSNAISAIENSMKQAALEPTRTFGDFKGGESATTRPMAVFAQIVTQSPGEIAAAGDEFLRFGYNCNIQWDFEGWNLLDRFTYWKVSDMWIDSLSIPDKYADVIRFALMGGVCVWRRPEYIGKTSIYENGI